MVLPAILIFFLFSISPVSAQTPVINPDSGIYLSEIMPAPPDNQEWVEIYNDNNFPVILENWQFDDIESGGGSPQSLVTINISASSFHVIEIGSGYLNNSSDSARLINQNGEQVDFFNYSTYSSSQSWSKQPDNSWCLVNPSKESSNNPCSSPSPTSTPSPSPHQLPLPALLLAPLLHRAQLLTTYLFLSTHLLTPLTWETVFLLSSMFKTPIPTPTIMSKPLVVLLTIIPFKPNPTTTGTISTARGVLSLNLPPTTTATFNRL